jgi:hypothetical protein
MNGVLLLAEGDVTPHRRSVAYTENSSHIETCLPTVVIYVA